MLDQTLLESVLRLLADGKPHLLIPMPAEQQRAILQQLAAWHLQPQQDAQQRYRLARPLDLLDQTVINRMLEQGSVRVFRCLDSTNEFLLNDKSLPSGTVCTAEMQTAGRGRRGRVWHSPFAQNLYFSLLRHFQQAPEQLKAISLVTAICIADTLVALGVQGISIKWPNDIYLHGRKLGGILIESRRFSTETQELVIGVGLNLAMQTSAAQQIDQTWANLNESAVRIERNHLVATLANHLQRAFTQIEQGNISHYLQRWQDYDHFYQQPITLLLEQHSISGICCGIDPQSGELLLQTADQQLQRFAIGEISLRALSVDPNC
ncbi:biotin--[acetyl-CoA-carboxylase] ligase [Testudinibacter sp. TR-2022]|uniref:biotin--[acetyl-CoA-carboxylase] ligase n=1 Tax=Testudinibacter sp. TR-2022 TaxID=2585029 RepID=UPI001119FF47|nr:biotin--[acetyl-CoA-carboxylase] ligase [Testudinibacter sp. TR-2022]TNH09366.1 biotin--[acetyl-CoA-carboxylase] ligase [Pasteurellaceae bacterium Phil11]TNH25062.1 biotin--[acetyl-CoA-carboxylase] ligase [Testudinibacter sp. TR-2022]TNH29392.1 biotin--[acetyl-CoA-carboxylase] ligase [Testudinibacter sp. TR-2022]